MKKLFILGLLCLSVLSGYAQDDSDDWKVGGKHYQEWASKQMCTEVCGVRFGSSYETAKEILKRKYGEPDYLETNENTIVYHYKSYGGMNFTYISFDFQRDGAFSYMSHTMGIDISHASCMDHTTTCKKTSRASAPQGMGRALAPVGALPPYLPRGFFTLTHEKNTQQIREREQREYRERKQFPQLEKNISPTRKIKTA